MTLVLDAGGVSALAGGRARLRELRDRGLWPALVPSVVLAEVLTGDHRRDFDVNRLLRTCQVREVGETEARNAARLRTATGRAASISAVDAIVAAFAAALAGAVIVTSDPRDLRVLVRNAVPPVRVIPA